MADNVERLVMRFEPDDAASRRVEQTAQKLAARIETLKKQVKDLRDEAKGLDRALAQDDKAFEAAIKNTVKLERARKELADAEKQLRREVDATATAQRDAAENARLYGDVESRTRAITGAVGYIGGTGIERSVNIGAEVLASVEAVGLLKQELPQLTANLVKSAGGVGNLVVGLGAVGATVGVAVLAYQGLKSALSESEKAAERAAQSFRTFTEINISDRDKTSEQLRQEIEALEANVKARETSIDVAERSIEVLEDNANAWDKIRDVVSTTKVEKLKDELDDLNAENEKDLDTIQQKTALLNSQRVVANDAANAEDELAQKRRDTIRATLAAIDEQVRAASELRKAIDTATPEQVTAQIEAFKDQQQALIDKQTLLQRALHEGEISLGDFILQYAIAQDGIDTLSFKIADWNTLVRDSAAERQRLADTEALAVANTEALYKSYQKVSAAQDKYAADLEAVQAQRAQLADDYAAETLAIEEKRNLDAIQEAEKFALKRTNDLADHYKDMADLDRDYYEQRGELLSDLNSDLGDIQDDELEAIKDYNKESARLAEDHYDDLAKIQERANRDIASAAARLDALGLLEAQQRANQELKDSEEAYKKEQKRREEDFKDQLDQYKKERRERQQQYRQDLQDLRRQHDRERAEKEAAFREELRREDQQRALEAQHQQEQWRREDTQREAQYQAERSALGEHYSRLLTLTTDNLYQIELEYEAWLESMATATSSQPVGAPTATVPIPQSPIAVGAAGGFPPMNRDVLVGERGPEIVRFMQPARLYATGQRPGAMDGASIVININGSRSPLQVGNQVRRELSQIIQEAA